MTLSETGHVKDRIQDLRSIRGTRDNEPYTVLFINLEMPESWLCIRAAGFLCYLVQVPYAKFITDCVSLLKEFSLWKIGLHYS